MRVMSELPPEDTIEYVDYLLEGLEGEIRLSERYVTELDSVDVYKRMLRAAYLRALERHEGDARDEA